MRKRILIGLLLFTVFSFTGGLYIIHSIQKAGRDHEKIITLHQVELLRESLLIHIEKVQTDLILKGTQFGRNINQLMFHVEGMENVVDACFNCHHKEKPLEKIDGLRREIDTYKNSLSRVFTYSANEQRLISVRDEAISKGEKLIGEIQEMIGLTTKLLNDNTMGLLSDISKNIDIIILFILVGNLIAVGFGIVFYMSFVGPISVLVDGSEKLRSGNLDHRIEGLNHEFGQVASSLNNMVESLKEQVNKMQRTEQMVAIGEIATGLAHEIKNPLSGIKVSVETLKDELNLSGEDRQVMIRVVEEIKRIEILIRNMLNFARPSTPHLEEVDIHLVIDVSINTASYTIKGSHENNIDDRHIEIVKNFGENIPHAIADQSQMQQVFLNLLLNAIEAMKGGGIVSVATRYDPGTNSVKIEISDTGDGLGEEDMENIFKPFYTTKKKGTGLGLAICKRLIELHDGVISVANNTDGGATFTIVLPVENGRG